MDCGRWKCIEGFIGVQEMTTEWQMEEVIAPAPIMKTKLSATWQINHSNVETCLITNFICNSVYLTPKKRF
jgi:hypothetical protein